MKALKNIFNNFLLFIRKKVAILLLGKDFCEKVNDLEEKVKFMAALMAEQSKLIASIAVIQNDIVSSVKEATIQADPMSTKDYFVIKIPLSNNDEPLN